MNEHEDRHRRPPGDQRVRVLQGPLSRSAAAARRRRGRAAATAPPSVEPLRARDGRLFLAARRRGRSRDPRRRADDARCSSAGAGARTRGRARRRARARRRRGAGQADALDRGRACWRRAPCAAARSRGRRALRAPAAVPRRARRCPRAAAPAAARRTSPSLGCGGLGTLDDRRARGRGRPPASPRRRRRRRALEPQPPDRSTAPPIVGTAEGRTPPRPGCAAFDARIDVESRTGGASTGPRRATRCRRRRGSRSCSPPTSRRTSSRAGSTTACVAARVPFITAGQLPPLLKMGPLYVPGQTACFALPRAGAAGAVARLRRLRRARPARRRAARRSGPRPGSSARWPRRRSCTCSSGRSRPRRRWRTRSTCGRCR